MYRINFSHLVKEIVCVQGNGRAGLTPSVILPLFVEHIAKNQLSFLFFSYISRYSSTTHHTSKQGGGQGVRISPSDR